MKIATIITFLLIAAALQAQTAVEKLKYEAYTQADPTKWLKAANYVEKNTDMSKTENIEEVIHCYYAYASALIAKKMRVEAAKAIEKGKKMADELLKKEPENALALNYKGCFIGYEIAMNKMKAITLGKSCMNYLNRAYHLNPNHPQILFDKGNSLYYPPRIFGGDKKEALKHYQKAIAILEKQNKTQHNWMYLQLLVVEAHSYELLGNDQLAEKSYLKALKTAPDFQLVKNELYPKLKSRMNGTSNEKPQERDYSLK